MTYFNDDCLEDPDDELLTVDIIEQLCDLHLPPENKQVPMIEREHFSRLLKSCFEMGVNTKFQLNELIIKHKDHIIAKEMAYRNQYESPYLYHCGMLYYILSLLWW